MRVRLAWCARDDMALREETGGSFYFIFFCFSRGDGGGGDSQWSMMQGQEQEMGGALKAGNLVRHKCNTSATVLVSRVCQGCRRGLARARAARSMAERERENRLAMIREEGIRDGKRGYASDEDDRGR